MKRARTESQERFVLVVYESSGDPDSSWIALIPEKEVEAVPGAAAALKAMHGQFIDCLRDDLDLQKASRLFDSLFWDEHVQVDSSSEDDDDDEDSEKESTENENGPKAPFSKYRRASHLADFGSGAFVVSVTHTGRFA